MIVGEDGSPIGVSVYDFESRCRTRQLATILLVVVHQLFGEELATVTGAFDGEVEVKTRGERDDEEGGVLAAD